MLLFHLFFLSFSFWLVRLVTSEEIIITIHPSNSRLIDTTHGLKVAQHNNEYIVALTDNGFVKYEFNALQGALTKKQNGPTSGSAENSLPLVPINSNHFCYSDNSRKLFISDFNTKTTSNGINVDYPSAKFSSATILQSDKTYFVFGMCNGQNGIALRGETSSASFNKKVASCDNVANEEFLCLSRKTSPKNIACFYALYSDKKIAAYKLFNENLDHIKSGNLAEVGLDPVSNSTTEGTKAVMISETMFVLCLLKEDYFYCGTGHINDGTISRYTATGDDKHNVDEDESVSQNFAILFFCHPDMTYVSLAVLDKDRFGGLCRDKVETAYLRYSVIRIYHQTKHLGFDIKNIALKFEQSISLPKFLVLHNNLLGLAYVDSSSKAKIEILNGANCKDFEITDWVNSDLQKIDFPANTHNKNFWEITDIYKIKLITVPPEVKIYWNRDVYHEVGTDRETPISEEIDYKTQSKPGTFVVEYGVIQDNVMSMICQISFVIKDCNVACNSCSDLGPNEGDTRCERGCAEGYYSYLDSPSQCLKKEKKKGGFYADDTTRQFKPCESPCLTCNTSASVTGTNCETCDISKGFYPYAHLLSECVKPPKKYYKKNNVLYRCPENCEECRDETGVCTRCEESFDYDPKDNSCGSKCSSTVNIKYFDRCVAQCPEGTVQRGKECLIKREECVNGLKHNINKYARENLMVSLDDGLSKCQSVELKGGRASSMGGTEINLGECEKLLRTENHISNGEPLYMVKLELYREDQITNQIEYTVFDKEGEELSLAPCKGVTIQISTQIKINETTSQLLDQAKQVADSGYNMFNSSDPFYNDVCTPFITEDKTDISVEDRKKVYYKNVPFCEEGCEFVGIDLEKERVSCSCNVKPRVDFKETDFSFNELGKGFGNVVSNSNIKVLKCYKLVFNFKNLVSNIGGWIMLLIGVCEIGFLVIYIVVGIKPLVEIINSILKANFSEANPPRKTKKKSTILKRNLTFKEPNDYGSLTRNSPSSTSICVSRKSSKLNIVFTLNENKLKGSDLYYDKPEFESGDSASFSKKSTLKSYGKVSTAQTIKEEAALFTDEDLNRMNYKDALRYDKRSFGMSYFSFLKYKQLILFTFVTDNDFNLKLLKIAMFLFSFAMFMTFNEFFYTDASMSNNYKRKGKFDFIYTLPQTIFSSITSVLINVLLKFLSLSQANIQKIKDQPEHQKAKELADKTIKHIKIKFAFFFTLVIIFLGFFWYYTSAFCSAFSQTQRNMVIDTLMTFGISMLYPFIFCIITCSIRILALKKQIKCLFYFSKIFSFL